MASSYCRLAGAFTIALIAAACGSTSHADLTPEPLTGLPERFLGAGDAGAAPAGEACRSPLRDPASGVVLTLVRSGRDAVRVNVGWGDYAVSPAGSYGIGADQLLRVECGSGRPAGVVPR